MNRIPLSDRRRRPTRTLTLLAAVTLLAALLAPSTAVGAATITVCTSGCDYSSIQAAINAAAPGDTISLAGEVFHETISVDRDVTIRGAGRATSVIDAASDGTVVTVLPGASLELDDLTIRNGRTTGNGGGINNQGSLSANSISIAANIAATFPTSMGGGVFSTGQLTLINSTVTGNESRAGGGGIYVSGAAATATIQGTIFTANVVHESTNDGRGGGAIHVSYGDATISDSEIADNTSDFTGGGVAIFGSGSNVAITDSWIHGNSSQFGGGLITESSSRLSINGTTISGNMATSSATSAGGGLRIEAPVTISNSTIAGNSATSTTANNNSGGGIQVESALTLDSVTIAGNSANYGGGIGSYSGSNTSTTNSILAGNTAATAANGNDCGGTLAGGDFLLIGDTDGCTTSAVGNVIVGDPLLEPLADNGGPTLTMLPGTGSPAIDAGATSLTSDQRGLGRPSGLAPDIGAVEVQTGLPPTPSPTPTASPTATPTAAPSLAAPTDLTATALSMSSIGLDWVDNSTGEDGYEVQRQEGSNFVPIDYLPPDAQSYADSNLDPDTAYVYRVRAFIGTTQFSDFSNPASATTLSTPSITPPPGLFDPPSDLVATAAGSERINLSWHDNSILEAGFELQSSADGSQFEPIDPSNPPLSRNAACWVDTGLAPQQQAYYRVRAFDADGNVTDWSNVASDTTAPESTPAPPPAEPILDTPKDFFACASGEASAELNWSDTASGEDSWLVQCTPLDPNEYCPSSVPGMYAPLPPDSTSFRVTGLKPDSGYEFAVRPVTGAGFSAEGPPYTDPVAVHPFAVSPPTDLHVTSVSAGSVGMAWTDTVFDESGWAIRRTGGRLGGSSGDVPAGVTSYVDDTFVWAGRTYFYSATPVPFGFGDEVRSNVASATTPIAGLDAVAWSSYATTYVELSWAKVIDYDVDGSEPHRLEIQRSHDGSPFQQVAVLDSAADQTSYDDTGMEPGDYEYRVRVSNDTLPGGPYSSPWTQIAVTVPQMPGACADGSTTDSDGDNLPDCWETSGYDQEGDGTIDINLAAMGASPQRKDIFVEVDCLVMDGNSDGDLADLVDHSHCPPRTAMEEVAAAFANAPVPNPDGTTGIQLHIDTGALYGAGVVFQVPGAGGAIASYGDLGGGGDQIPEDAAPIFFGTDTPATPYYQDPPGTITDFYAIKAAHFDPRRAQIFRYALFGHQTAARRLHYDCTSGVAEGIPGNDFYVTLGGRRDLGTTDNPYGDGQPDMPCWTPTAANGIDDDGDGLIDEDPWNGVDDDGDCPGDTNNDGKVCSFGDIGVDEDSGWSVGSVDEQAGAFMHELGHTLGLRHGGGTDLPPYKPNYLSVMNYYWQACRVPASPNGDLPGGCDYSREVLPDLVETNLDECAGIDGPGHTLGFGPINWNRDGTEDAPIFEGATCPAPNNANIEADIGGNLGAIDTETYAGWEDWSHLVYDFTSLSSFANGVADPQINEPTPESIAEGQRILEQEAGATLLVEKTGPAVAFTGQTIGYTLTVRNVGSGPAYNVVLTDTRPDGSQVVFQIGTLAAGAQETRAVGMTVSQTAANSTIGDSATVVYDDLGAQGKTASTAAETFVCADVNADLNSTAADVAAVARAMRTRPGDGRWNPRADFNGDGVIDVRDLAIARASVHDGRCGQ